MTKVLVVLYLAAIVVANLTVAALGPWITPINAFWLIGLDLTARDRLHERWQDDRLRWKMSLLIATGGVISWLLNRDAGQIALASTVAFVISAGLDATVFQLLDGRPRMVRINASNVAGAAADSILFPTLAFGSLLPLIVLGQFAAKVAGGFLWSLVLHAHKRWVLT